MPRSWMIAAAALCAAGTTLCPNTVHAQPADADGVDWPMFQYDAQRTGVCDYPAIDVPAVAWSTHVGIMGYLNNPVIDAGRVYVGSSGTTHNTPDAMDGIYCLDLATGEVLWHHPTQTDACGVAISATLVFAGDDGGVFQALDRETGEVVWSLRSASRTGLMDGEGVIVSEIESRSTTVSVFAQPLLVEDLVIVGDSAGLVYAARQATGEVVWALPQAVDQNPSRERNAIRGGLSSDGEQVYGVLVGGRAFAIGLDGEALWDWSVNGEWAEFYGCPTVDMGRLYLAGANYSWELPTMVALDTATGKPVWDNNARQGAGRGNGQYFNIRTSPAAYDGILFYAETASDRLIGVEAATGDPVWHDPVGVPAYVQWASPVIASDMMYLARPDGTLYALLASDRTPVWHVYLGDHAQHGETIPPAILHHRDAWSKPAVGDALYATPAVARDGTLVIGSGDGWLYGIHEQRER